MKNWEAAFEDDVFPILDPALSENQENSKQLITPKNIIIGSLGKKRNPMATFEMIGTEMKDGIYSENGYTGKLCRGYKPTETCSMNGQQGDWNWDCKYLAPFTNIS